MKRQPTLIERTIDIALTGLRTYPAKPIKDRWVRAYEGLKILTQTKIKTIQ